MGPNIPHLIGSLSLDKSLILLGLPEVEGFFSLLASADSGSFTRVIIDDDKLEGEEAALGEFDGDEEVEGTSLALPVWTEAGER